MKELAISLAMLLKLLSSCDVDDVAEGEGEETGEGEGEGEGELADACGALPGSPVFAFDADTLDLPHGSLVGEWSGNGVASQLNFRRQPQLLRGAINGRNALSFDGVSDQLLIEGSAQSMASLTSGHGQLVVVYRHDASKVAGYGQVISSTNSPSAGPGFMWGVNPDSTGFLFAVGASSSTAGFSTPAMPVGETRAHQIKADGVALSYSQTGAATLTASVANLQPSASLAGDVSIGCRTGSQVECTDGAVALVAFYDDALDASTQAELDSFLECRYTLASQHKPSVRIAATGDSLTIMSEPRGERGYGPLLEQMLVGEGVDALVGTTAKNSTVSTAHLGYVRGQVLGKGYTHLVIWSGYNDAWTATPAAAVNANLAAMVSEAQADGLQVIVVKMPPWKTNFDWTQVRQDACDSIDAFIDTLPDVVTIETQDVLGDPLNPGALRPEFWTDDKIHINSAGALALAQAIHDAVEWN